MLSSWYSWSSQSQGNSRQKMDFPAVEKLGQTFELLGALLLPKASSCQRCQDWPSAARKPNQEGEMIFQSAALTDSLRDALQIPFSSPPPLDMISRPSPRVENGFSLFCSWILPQQENRGWISSPISVSLQQLPPETQEKSPLLGAFRVRLPKAPGSLHGETIPALPLESWADLISLPCVWFLWSSD